MSLQSTLELKRELTKMLSDPLGQEARAAVSALMCDFWGWDFTSLALNLDREVSDADARGLRSMASRLARHEPLQYVTGRCEFCGMGLSVGPGVLIPRPETEQLADMVVKMSEGMEGLRVLDIGTGSGCIALALNKMLRKPKVTAIDVSPQALAVARRNAIGTDIDVRQVDVFSLNAQEVESFDVVVSNPPYVLESEREAMDANVVDYEPGLALFVKDEDPLVFYRKIADLCAGRLLSAGGVVAVETNERLTGEVAELMGRAGLCRVDTHKDYLGKERFVTAAKGNR